MAAFTPLRQGIYCVDACYVEAQVASIYLLQQGDEVAIIETGTSHSLENVLDTLQTLGIADSQIRYVIPTHVHLDHAGGASAMMRRFTEASLIIHPRGLRHMADPEKLVAGSKAVYGEEKFNRLYGRIDPIPELRMIVANDLDEFQLGSRSLVFFDTQGHARHHFCIFDQLSGGVFTGDTFGVCYEPMKQFKRGLLPTTPPSQFDPEALHQSAAKIMSYKPRKLYLTHYGEYPNPDRQLASFRRWIDEYVSLCREYMSDDATSEKRLEQALSKTILEQMESSDNAQIGRILKTDIHLNAQGLAYWWRTTQNV